MTKIKRHDGSKVTLNDKNQVWYFDDTGGRQIGQIFAHGICNVWPTSGPSDDLLPVSRMLLKYRRKLGIKKIRREFRGNVRTEIGDLTTVQYGYLDRSNFKYLLSHRELSKMHSGLFILVKVKDFELHSK